MPDFSVFGKKRTFVSVSENTEKMESKTSLRAAVRSESARRDARSLAEMSERIAAAVEGMDEFVRARDVALYWSLPDEVRTHALAERWYGR